MVLSLKKHVEIITSTSNNSILMGDFDDLKTVMKMHGLSQIIKEATRRTKDSSTIIDHIYVSEPGDIYKSGVIHMGVSDHQLVYVVLGKIKCYCNVNIKFCSFRNLNEDECRKDLYAVEWNEIKKMNDEIICGTIF